MLKAAKLKDGREEAQKPQNGTIVLAPLVLSRGHCPDHSGLEGGPARRSLLREGGPVRSSREADQGQSRPVTVIILIRSKLCRVRWRGSIGRDDCSTHERFVLDRGNSC